MNVILRKKKTYIAWDIEFWVIFVSENLIIFFKNRIGKKKVHTWANSTSYTSIHNDQSTWPFMVFQ
jgi:hypothetical protein